MWLGVTQQNVQNMLNNSRFDGPEEARRWCSESTQSIKMTIRFYVLASVTTQQVPRFLETYREIFNSTFIGELLCEGAGGAVGGEVDHNVDTARDGLREQGHTRVR